MLGSLHAAYLLRKMFSFFLCYGLRPLAFSDWDLIVKIMNNFDVCYYSLKMGLAYRKASNYKANRKRCADIQDRTKSNPRARCNNYPIWPFYTSRQLLYDTVMITVVLLLVINIITSVALCDKRCDLLNIVCSVLVSCIIIIIIKLKNQHLEEFQGRFNLLRLKGKYMHHLVQH